MTVNNKHTREKPFTLKLIENAQWHIISSHEQLCQVEADTDMQAIKPFDYGTDTLTEANK